MFPNQIGGNMFRTRAPLFFLYGAFLLFLTISFMVDQRQESRAHTELYFLSDVTFALGVLTTACFAMGWTARDLEKRVTELSGRVTDLEMQLRRHQAHYHASQTAAFQ
jgi:hypothetical protein